jgi:hypothetical protein
VAKAPKTVADKELICGNVLYTLHGSTVDLERSREKETAQKFPAGQGVSGFSLRRASITGGFDPSVGLRIRRASPFAHDGCDLVQAVRSARVTPVAVVCQSVRQISFYDTPVKRHVEDVNPVRPVFACENGDSVDPAIFI